MGCVIRRQNWQQPTDRTEKGVRTQVQIMESVSYSTEWREGKQVLTPISFDSCLQRDQWFDGSHTRVK